MELAKKNGVEFQQWASETEKARIVDYMLEHGSAEAAQKYGLHPGTINKYAREFQVGTKKRYEKLQVRAEALFKEGCTTQDVSAKLGVDRKTSRVWLKKLGN